MTPKPGRWFIGRVVHYDARGDDGRIQSVGAGAVYRFGRAAAMALQAPDYAAGRVVRFRGVTTPQGRRVALELERLDPHRPKDRGRFMELLG